MAHQMQSEPFSIHVDEAILADLRDRIGKTRWPDQVPGTGWQQGTDLTYVQELLAYWADGFDWRAQERRLNGFDHFHAELDGILVHFVHQRARSGHGIPVILTHGWPSSFVEYLPMVPLLTDPHAHGIDGPAFDVVIPSLPGYGTTLASTGRTTSSSTRNSRSSAPTSPSDHNVLEHDVL